MIKLMISILSLFFLISIVSCKHDCYRDPTSAEIRRLGYTGGEILIFKSSTGLYDTALIGEIDKTNEALEKKCKNKKYRYGIGSYFKHRFYDSTILGLQLYIDVYSPDAKSKTFVYPEISFYGGYTFNESQKGTQTINGQQYANVYELTNQVPSFKCQKIYFSLERGLLKVANKDGTYWERINL